jgi:ABC-2 type transport system permease protein
VRDQASRRTAGSIGFGSLVYILLMQAIVLTGLSLREKENRTFARIRSAPVPGAAYALGNLLAAFTVLAAQVTATLLILRFALGMDLTVPFGAAAALLLALSLAAIGAGVMIAGLAGSSLEASLAGNLAVTVSTLLSGCFWPIDALPAFLRRAAVVFPQTWVMEAVAGLQRGAPAASLAPAILVLLAFAALFAAAAAYGFRSGRDQRRFG